MKRKILQLIVSAILISSIFPISAYAHRGKTDGAGGHTDHSTGEYHYHHGYPAHDHYDMDDDGIADCPYNFDDKTDHSHSVQESKSADSNKSESIKPIRKRSFFDVVSALFSGIAPTFAITLLLSVILSHIIFFLFGDDKGWTIACVMFYIIFAVVYVQFVTWLLS